MLQPKKHGRFIWGCHTHVILAVSCNNFSKIAHILPAKQLLYINKHQFVKFKLVKILYICDSHIKKHDPKKNLIKNI